MLYFNGKIGGKRMSARRSAAMTEPVTIYGIKVCDTMKKARAWLETHGVSYAFHDYKVQGIEHGVLEAWARVVGWETLINRAGTTFRKLPDANKAGLDEGRAIALMHTQPSMIKRPVLAARGALIIGFTPEKYAMTFRGSNTARS
jgi:arsenate reductase